MRTSLSILFVCLSGMGVGCSRAEPPEVVQFRKDVSTYTTEALAGAKFLQMEITLVDAHKKREQINDLYSRITVPPTADPTRRAAIEKNLAAISETFNDAVKMFAEILENQKDVSDLRRFQKEDPTFDAKYLANAEAKLKSRQVLLGTAPALINGITVLLRDDLKSLNSPVSSTK